MGEFDELKRLAEAKLEQMLNQKPVAWMDAEGDVYKDEPVKNWCPPHIPLYASVVPAHPGTTHCDNCGCTWLDDGLNPIGCPYCKSRS